MYEKYYIKKIKLMEIVYIKKPSYLGSVNIHLLLTEYLTDIFIFIKIISVYILKKRNLNELLL